MKVIDKIQVRKKELGDEEARARKATKWEARVLKLKNRKKGPKNETEFCQLHGIDEAQFSRYKNGARTPGPDAIEKIEAAFRVERV